jgi:uncharacterized protein HemX
MQAVAPKLHDKITGNGDIHFSIEPDVPELGTIVNEQGETVNHPPKTMMVKIDEKTTEKVTVSKGTIGIAGVVLALVVYIITVAMNYQGNLSKVTELDTRLTRVENAVAEIQSIKLSMSTIQNDVSSIRTTQKEADSDRKDILKSMGDIRILLAQKQITGAQ